MICVYILTLTEAVELKDCLMALVDDQQKLSSQTAKSTLSALRLSQRLVILERYLISLTHSMMEEKYKVRWKSPPSPLLSAVDNKRYEIKVSATKVVRAADITITITV